MKKPTWKNTDFVGVIREPNGDETLVFIDDADGTTVVARMDNVTGVELFDPVFVGGEDDDVTFWAVETKSAGGAKSWRLVVYQHPGEGSNKSNHTHVVRISPPLRPLKVFSNASTKAWAVEAGTEPGLYLPIRDDGTLAWFPEGVIGVKPILFRNNWVGWIVRWKTPVEGWSLSWRKDLGDVSGNGAAWKDLAFGEADEPVHDRNRGFVGLETIAGTRHDGSCDVTQYTEGSSDSVSGWGPTCAIAQQRMLELYAAVVSNNNARLEALNAESERRERAVPAVTYGGSMPTACANAPADRHSGQ